jgi:hypothetical protein
LFEHCDLLADSRAAWTAGNNKPTKIPMMAMTTNNSTSVNPRLSKRFTLFIPTALPGKEWKRTTTNIQRQVAAILFYQIRMGDAMFCVKINRIKPDLRGPSPLTGGILGRFCNFSNTTGTV